ncbi:hypothetical protein [Ensifer aridi]|uniref:hypothetical protein n=1 Tax=Ensifer aridi TaxID=1708715 RepID=UPI000A0FD4AD|nr:hypothetical protein [Ensifer aridi]
MKIVLQLTPEAEARDMTMRTLAPARVIELARELQRAAFHGERTYADDFEPAPLYLQQAFVMWENDAVRSAVANAIGAL